MAGRLAVIGAGLMGAGIAQVAAQAGWQVTLRDLDDAAVQRGVAGIRTSLERFAAKGAISSGDAETALGRITPTTEMEAAADADIVVAAAFGKLHIKQAGFPDLDQVCHDAPGPATHTSVLPLPHTA